ncbi:MAG: glycosyltransferase family 4 protein [Gloeomargarita sp. SKYBB_i_bin120]|nr:glycosyltransferase family 4 protein [Gloeomargarita sp. SKYB120]MDW8176981.1 glycosyltransferase family 4 protein [Gloeomargarita sp. SKYBB_i_bin120]
MKVALVCPFDLDRLSGTPVRAQLTAKALHACCALQVYATGGSAPYVHPIPNSWTNRFRLDRFTWGVLQAFQQFQPDVIHLVNPAGILAALAYKARHPHVKIVTEIHGLTRYEMTQARPWSRWTFQQLERLSLTRADHIIAVSYSQRDLIVKQLGADLADRVTVIWGPVEVQAIPYTAPPPGEPLRVGYLGNGSSWQGIDLILHAVERLRPYPQIHFVLAGIQPDRYRLRLPNPLPSNLTVVPTLPRGEEGTFLSQCHGLISSRIGGPVSDSQYPYKLSYYLAAGRPVIASAVSDQPLILQQAGCGWLFDPAQPETLVQCLLHLWRLEAPQRQALGERGRRFAETHLDSKQLGPKLLAIYKR